MMIMMPADDVGCAGRLDLSVPSVVKDDVVP